MLGEPGKVWLVHQCALTHRFCLRISGKYAWYIGMDGCILQIKGPRQSMEEVCPVNRYLRLRSDSGAGLPGINHVQFIGIAFPAKTVGWALW